MWIQAVEPNLDPVIYQPNGRGGSYALTDWVGWCLAYVATAYKSGWAGSTAWEAWEKTTKKRHTGRDFPIGVKFPIWFSGFNGDGHVAIMLKTNEGKITIWTSPYKTRKPNAEIVQSIEQLERDLAVYNVKYVGWSEDIGGTTVIKHQGKVLGSNTGGTMEPSLEVRRIAHSELEGWDINKTHAGEFDKQFLDARIPGEDTNAFIFRKWKQNDSYRKSKETWRKFYEQYSGQINDLLKAKEELAALKSKGIADPAAVELKDLIKKLVKE